MRNIIISSAQPCANPCAKKGEKRVHNLGTIVERYTRKPLYNCVFWRFPGNLANNGIFALKVPPSPPNQRKSL